MTTLYRQPATSPFLDVRPAPRTTMIGGVFAGIVLLVVAVASLAGFAFVPIDPSQNPGILRGLLLAFAVAGTMAGVFFLRSSMRTLNTMVRFTLQGPDVVVEWRRSGAVIRTERIAHEDVVAVGIDDAPASGGDFHHTLAIETKLGQLTLSEWRTGDLAFYERQRDALAGFLGVTASAAARVGRSSMGGGMAHHLPRTPRSRG